MSNDNSEPQNRRTFLTRVGAAGTAALLASTNDSAEAQEKNQEEAKKQIGAAVKEIHEAALDATIEANHDVSPEAIKRVIASYNIEAEKAAKKQPQNLDMPIVLGIGAGAVIGALTWRALMGNTGNIESGASGLSGIALLKNDKEKKWGDSTQKPDQSLPTSPAKG